MPFHRLFRHRRHTHFLRSTFMTHATLFCTFCLSRCSRVYVLHVLFATVRAPHLLTFRQLVSLPVCHDYAAVRVPLVATRHRGSAVYFVCRNAFFVAPYRLLRCRVRVPRQLDFALRGSSIRRLRPLQLSAFWFP